MTKVRDKKFLIQFGKHLRKVRLVSGLSQEDLANDAEIPISQVSRIERGEVNPSLSTLLALAKALRLKLGDLVDF